MTTALLDLAPLMVQALSGAIPIVLEAPLLLWLAGPGCVLFAWTAMWRGAGETLRTRGWHLLAAVCAGLLAWYVAVPLYASRIVEYAKKEEMWMQRYAADYAAARCDHHMYSTQWITNGCVELKYRLDYGTMQLAIDRRHAEIVAAVGAWLDALWYPRLLLLAAAAYLGLRALGWLAVKLYYRQMMMMTTTTIPSTKTRVSSS